MARPFVKHYVPLCHVAYSRSSCWKLLLLCCVSDEHWVLLLQMISSPPSSLGQAAIP
jgi:hypothetical protein